MAGPSNRSHTGDQARAALANAIMKHGLDGRRIVEHMERHGFIIVPHPYTRPAVRGGARAQIAKANKEALRADA
jgi:hypothetical protein